MTFPSSLSSRTVLLIGLLSLLSASGCATQTDSDEGLTRKPTDTASATDQTAGTASATTATTSTDDEQPENTTGSDIRMLKMEKLRSQMFNPGTSSSLPADATTAVVRRSLKSVSDAAAGVAPPPHQQIAILREGSRERMQQQLSRLFEDTRRAKLARWRAKQQQQQQQYENATAE